MRVNKNARGGDCKNDLANIMKLVIALVFTITVALLNITAKPQPKPVDVHISEKASAQTSVKPTNNAGEPALNAPLTPAKPFNANDPTTWPKCAQDEIVRADNGQCSKKPAQPTVAPSGAVSGVGTGDCAAEIVKYDWNVQVATAISQAESGLSTGAVGDTSLQYYQDGAKYGASYGCFQIRHLPGRPSPDNLLDAANNVRYAYGLYKGQGWQPWSVYKNGMYQRYLR